MYFSGDHLFKINACERFTSDNIIFVFKSIVKTEKSMHFLFVDLSSHDVKSKNASSINVTLSLFLFFHPLVIKFYCFIPKYLLIIEIPQTSFNANFLYDLSLVCVQICQQKALFLSHVTLSRSFFLSTFLPKRDPLKIFLVK